MDLFRFIAAVAVMLYHYCYTGTAQPEFPTAYSFARFGYLGVEFFFVISGFVIVWSAQARSVMTFARARIVRLYPEFWIALAISSLVFWLTKLPHFLDLSTRDIVLNATMVPQYLGAEFVDGVYWSLGVEIKFYALLAAVIALRLLKRLESLAYLALCVMALGQFVDLGAIVDSVTLGRFGPLFVGGALFYFVYERGLSFPRALGIAIACALAAIHASSSMGDFVLASEITSRTKLAAGVTVVGIFALFALAVCFRDRIEIGSWSAVVGSLTYPLYLLHNSGKAIFIYGFETYPLGLRILGAVAFSLGIAYAVQWFASGYVTPLLRNLLASKPRVG